MLQFTEFATKKGEPTLARRGDRQRWETNPSAFALCFLLLALLVTFRFLFLGFRARLFDA